MKRPHPLALILFAALLLLVAWLLNLVALTNPIVEKLPYNGYWRNTELYDREFERLPLTPSILAGILVALLPTLVLHRVLRRTLHIHLFSAMLLSLTVATLLALNFHPRKVPTRVPFGDPTTYIELQYGWPQCAYKDPSDIANLNYSLDSTRWFTPFWLTSSILGNALIALAILSLVLLLSESLLARRNSPREATP